MRRDGNQPYHAIQCAQLICDKIHAAGRPLQTIIKGIGPFFAADLERLAIVVFLPPAVL